MTPSPTPPEATSRRASALILVAAALTRSLWALAVPVHPTSDSLAYDAFARSLASGQGYGWSGDLTAFWPVGTSFYYSLYYRVFGLHHAPIVVGNIVLGVAIVALAMLLGRRWFGPRVAVLAGAILAFWPLLIEFTTILASELPFLVAVLGALAVATDRRLAPRARDGLTGLGLALACYIRPTALLLPAGYLVIRLREGDRPTRAAAGTLLAVAVTAACIAPWSVRNTRLFGEFVLISTNGGTVNWMGNTPSGDGIFDIPPYPDEVEGLNEAQRDRVLGRLASEYIHREPARFLRRTVWKLARLHDRESIGVVWNQAGLDSRYPPGVARGLKLGSTLYWWLALGLGIVGVGVELRRSGWVATLTNPALLLWTYFALVHSIPLVQDRYHVPSIPAVALFAASAIEAGRGRRSLARQPAVPAPA